MTGDFDVAWSLTDAPHRLALVQSWLMVENQAGDDALASSLADDQLPPDRWAQFAAWRLGRWRDIVFKDLMDREWGTLDETEPVGPDLEFAVLVIGHTAGYVDPGQQYEVQFLTMRLTDLGWLVAGVGRTVPVPGWPPSEIKVDTDQFGTPRS